jgi:hypothetical protein
MILPIILMCVCQVLFISLSISYTVVKVLLCSLPMCVCQVLFISLSISYTVVKVLLCSLPI